MHYTRTKYTIYIGKGTSDISNTVLICIEEFKGI